jgi:hypothetical protein
MARLGRVAIDSTRIKANASADRLARQDQQQVRRWRREMEQEDPDQDPGLEVEATTAERLRERMSQTRSATGSEPRSQTVGMARGEKRSLTDEDARFLRERGGRFKLGYSAELAVSEDHFIVAARVTQQAADTASLLPMLEQVEQQCGEKPRQVLADSGFYSGANLDGLRERGLDGYVADTNLAAAMKAGGEVRQGNRCVRHSETLRMREKLRTPRGRRTYLHRKAMVEPVIGTLKEQRGMRQFLRRGLNAVHREWLLACISYNLTRAYRLLR